MYFLDLQWLERRLLRPLTLGLGLLFSQIAWSAADYQYLCQQADAIRKIQVTYSAAPSPVPCEVVYIKADSAKVLWSAQNQTDYCESQAQAFVAKQEGWGWHCEQQMDSPKEEEALAAPTH